MGNVTFSGSGSDSNGFEHSRGEQRPSHGHDITWEAFPGPISKFGAQSSPVHLTAGESNNTFESERFVNL